ARITCPTRTDCAQNEGRMRMDYVELLVKKPLPGGQRKIRKHRPCNGKIAHAIEWGGREAHHIRIAINKTFVARRKDDHTVTTRAQFGSRRRNANRYAVMSWLIGVAKKRDFHEGQESDKKPAKSYPTI